MKPKPGDLSEDDAWDVARVRNVCGDMKPGDLVWPTDPYEDQHDDPNFTINVWIDRVPVLYRWCRLDGPGMYVGEINSENDPRAIVLIKGRLFRCRKRLLGAVK